MKIINQTKGSILADKATLAANFYQRAIGLLGPDHLAAGEALIIKPCNSVHTFFMRFPIDVIFVDKQYQVVQTISGLKPFRISSIHWSSALVIELPVATIQQTCTSSQDTLTIS